MEYREFGSTGLIVSSLGFGSGHIGWDGMSDGEAERLLNEVVDAGITLIDTARGYGLAEERIGKFLSKRRDEFVLSTKCGYDVPGTENWTYECVKQGIDLALKTLQTDRIDIMHLHSCERDVLDAGGVVQALHEAQNAGKIVSAAYSGENETLAHAAQSMKFTSLQCSVNVCDLRVIHSALAEARRHGLGVIAKRPLANAFWRFEEQPKGHYCEEYWQRAKKMGLHPGDLDWTEMALRFSAHVPGVHSIIVGTSNINHLKHNIEALKKGPLPESLEQEIMKRFEENDEGWVGQV